MADMNQSNKYQLGVTAYLASLLSKNKTVKNYYIFYEVQEVQPFNDIVLAVQYNGSEDFSLCLVQVKSGEGTIEIDTYLNDYTEIIKNKKLTFLENIGKINERNIQFWYFTCQHLSTSQDISFKEDSEIKQLEFEERESYGSKSMIVKKYNKNYKLSLKDNSTTTKHQDFFDNFYVYLQQPNSEKIVRTLGAMWKLNNPSQLIDYLGKYLTTNKTARFSKTVFEHELLRIRLSNYIVTPIKVIPVKKKPADAWINLTLSHSVTLIEDALYTTACLFGCILVKIGDIITVDEWNKCVGNEGKLSEAVKEKFPSEVFKPQTLKDLIIHLWKSNKIPLILKAEDNLPVLKEFSHLKLHYIIIDSMLKKRYDEMTSYNLNVIRDLRGLQVDELLQSISVSMQGKKPTSLYEVINGDKTLLETLTCSDILKLMEPKQVYLKNECLKDSSDMLFIIETEDAEKLKHKNYNTIEDNILMYCPPNESDLYYLKAIEDPKFKNYKIYRLQETSEASERKLSLMKECKSTGMEVDEGGNIDESNSANGHAGLEYFFVDQHGNSVYIENQNEAVPVIGEMINLSCPRYLSRRMRKGIIKRGKDNKLNPVIEYTESPFWEEDFFNRTTSEICVVIGEPGLGKTTFLRSLVKLCQPQYYVVFCDLALYQADLYDKNRQQSELCSDPFNFLWNKHNSLPYSKFLSVLKEVPERLIIILDSLDEVVATCRENVLKLINKLSCELCLGKIIIASRLLTMNLLSNQVDVDLVEIEDLNNEWNGDYIRNWNIDENYIRNIPAVFLKNPLYLNFLKTIAASNIDIKTLNRWSLYKTIIDLKIDLYCERRNQNPDNTDRNNILKYCYALALQAFLPNNRITRKLAENIKEKYTNFVRIGIIRCFTTKGMPVFIHSTILEFLISRWLIETSDTDDAKYIYEYILRKELDNILYIHSEKFRLHKAVIDKDLTQVQKICNENPELLRETDELGRTALHIAALEGLIFKQTRADITDTILQNVFEKNFNLYPGDKLLNWTWIDYCHRYLRHNVDNIYRLSDAILEAYWNYQYQIKNESFWKCMDDQRFYRFWRQAFEIPSINIIRNLFLLKFYNNKDLLELNELCLNSEVTAAALPEISMSELGSTIMHFGCIYSNINIVSACIDRGHDINAGDMFGCTPLYYGVCSQNSEVVELLIVKGAIMKLHSTLTLFGMSLRMQNKSILMMLIIVMDKSLQAWGWSTPLQDALNYDNIRAIEMLLRAGVNVNISNAQGDTLLHLVVRNRNKRLIQLLSQYQLNINLPNKKGQPPLFDALRTEDIQLIEMLLNLGADVNIADKQGNTPLGIAVKYCKDLIPLLLQYGANVNGANRIGETPLFRTVKFNDTQKTKMLLNARANVNVRDINGSTVLHIAVDRSYCKRTVSKVVGNEENDNMQIIKMLLNASANVNVINKRGLTPIYMAVSDGFEDAVRLLSQHGASVCPTNPKEKILPFLRIAEENVTHSDISRKRKYTDINCDIMESPNGDTPLCCAVRNQNVEIINILLENEASVNYVDKSGRHLTPLFSAIETQNLEIIEILLHKGANVNFKSLYDITPLYVAVLIGNLNMVKLLLKHKANTHTVTSMNTLLTKAKQRDYINAAMGLLNYWAEFPRYPLNDETFSNDEKNFIQAVSDGANISLTNELDLHCQESNVELVCTLLNYAAELKNQKPIGIYCLNAVLELDSREVDQMLLDNFISKYETLILRYTDIGYAAIQRNATMIKILLRNKQNTNNTFLTRVIRFYDEKYPIEFLLENQIDVNLPDEYGDIPLLTAVDCSTPDVVRILLENGAAVNGVNNRDPTRTPLGAAIEEGKSKIVEILLQKGANINVEKKPLLHLALANGSSNIVRMLLEHGADPNQIDESGQSPLHRAVEMNRKHIVKKLLEFKADVNIADKNGLIPLDNAIAANKHGIIRILRRKENDEDYYSESYSNDSDYNDDDGKTLYHNKLL